MPAPVRFVLGLLGLAALAGLTGCGGDSAASTAPPEKGGCRLLAPRDLDRPDDVSTPVPCTRRHTAETFLVGAFPAALARAAYDSPRLDAYVHGRCAPRFRRYVGADESLAMRTLLTWVWFRPPRDSWEAGAGWFRCDVVGGGVDGAALASLPPTVRHLLLGKPSDAWMVCARGRSVDAGTRVPCSARHDWRAVTTIKVGEPGDAFPGDREVALRTERFCADSVAAWLEYPVDYDFGYTWFHAPEWKVGNRRSVCWAATEE
jgi:hypothetical protein